MQPQFGIAILAIAVQQRSQIGVAAPSRAIGHAHYGLWRRLDAGDRMISGGACGLLESRTGHLTREFERDRLPERWVHGAEVHGLLAGMLVMRMIGMMGGSDTEAQQAELLAGEGLMLSLLVDRVYYAGGPLLDFMKRAERAGSS